MVEPSAQLEQHSREVKIQGSDTTGQREIYLSHCSHKATAVDPK